MSKKLALSIARQRLAYGGAPFFSYDYRDIAFPEVQQPPTFNPPDFSQQPLPPLSDISLYGTPGGPQPRPFEPYVPPTPAVPNAPQAPTTSGGGGDGSGGFGGTYGGDYGQTSVDQGDLGQPGSIGSAIGSIGSGIANAAGYGQGMTVGNTIGGVLGGVLGTAVAGPIGGILGGIAGRHAANAMAEPETMDSSATKDASPGATEASAAGPSSQSSPGSVSAAQAEAAEAAAANMGDMGSLGATPGGETSGPGVGGGSAPGGDVAGNTEGATPGGETGGPGVGGGSAAGAGAGAGAGEGEGDGDSGGGVGGVGGDAGGGDSGGGGEGGGGGGDGMGGMGGEAAGDAGGEAGAGESGGGESGGGGEGGYEYGGRVGYADGGETVEFYPDPESQLPESMRGQVMAPADPTIRQRMADFLATAGGTRDESAVTRRFGEGMADVVGMTPVGIPMAYEETKRAMRKGDYPEAALSAVGMIPGAKPGAKAVVDTAKNVLARPVLFSEKQEETKAALAALKKARPEQLKRAKEQGFDVSKVWLHGTRSSPETIEPNFWISRDPGIADVYARRMEWMLPEGEIPEGAAYMPVFVKKNAAQPGRPGTGYYVVPNPEDVRSIWAEFSAEKIKSPRVSDKNGGAVTDRARMILSRKA